MEDILNLAPTATNLYPSSQMAYAQPVQSYLCDEIAELRLSISGMLGEVAGGSGEYVSVVITGTGTLGVEFAVCNLISPGSLALVINSGYFAQRLVEILQRLGVDVVQLQSPWGTAPDLVQLEKQLKALPSIELVCVVHLETSTGAISDLRSVGKIVAESNAMLLVDAVSSFGGSEIGAERNSIDCVVGASQKCMSAGQGLAWATMSPRALRRAKSVKPSSWHLDLRHHYDDGGFKFRSINSNLLSALAASLTTILGEGLGNVFTRHSESFSTLRKGLARRRAELLAPNSSLVACIELSGEVSSQEAVKTARRLFGAEIGTGIGGFRDRYIRVALMGNNARLRNALLALEIVDTVLHRRP